MNDSIQNMADSLKDRFPGNFAAKMAIVCGSGLAAKIADHAEIIERIPYGDIDGFPKPSVSGHQGELFLARFADSGADFLAFAGRVHLYEGISTYKLLFQVRLTKALSFKNIIITCSVGSVCRYTPPGSVGLISEHIDLQMLGNRHIPIAKYPRPTRKSIYDRELAQIIKNGALRAGIEMRSGVLCSVSGPTYETPAEAAMAKKIGADWLSMSTAKETAEAASLGLRTAGLVGVANFVDISGSGNIITSHDDVLLAADRASESLWRCFSAASQKLV